MHKFISIFFMAVFTAFTLQAATIDCKTFTLRLSPNGTFKIKNKSGKLVEGNLFFNLAKKNGDHRYIQPAVTVQESNEEHVAMQGKDLVISFKSEMYKKISGLNVPYNCKIQLTPDGKLKYEAELIIPPNTKFKNKPCIILYMPMSTIAGRELLLSNLAGKTIKKIVPLKYDVKKRIGGANLRQFQVKQDKGELTLIAQSGPISFHDTRSYERPGALRVDVAAKNNNGKWKISFTLELPFKPDFSSATSFLSPVETFTPNFKTWDIYLPFLKRYELSGWWKLKKLKNTRNNPLNDKGRKEKFFSPEYQEKGWKYAMVPGDWHKPFMVPLNELGRATRTFGGVGWYRRSFEAPELKDGERAILHFDEVVHEAEIYLNGKKIGKHKNYRPEGKAISVEDFEIDISKNLIPGKTNLLSLRVYQLGLPLMWIYAPPGGITGRVYLDVRPACSAKNILISPHDNLKEITYKCNLEGDLNSNTVNWSVEAFEWMSGKIVAKGKVGKAVNGTINAKLNIPNAKQWSCESPFLYGLKFKDAQGNVTGIKRFGMRSIHARDGQFWLNNKPLMLRGLCLSARDFSKYGTLFFNNEGNALRRRLRLYRDANINHMRIHTGIMTSISYDLMDEMGFVITDELGYPGKHIKNSNKADKIFHENFDFACDKNGALLPEFLAQVRKRLNRQYSHPCIATFSFGNEMRNEGRCAKMFNNLYDLYKKIDKQNRPITPSSGRFWKDASNVTSLRLVDKLDYVDTHDYTGGINNWPVAYCQPVAENFVKAIKKAYPKQNPPIVNGEAVFYQSHYYPHFYSDIWSSDSADEPNWKKYLWTMTKLSKKSRIHAMMSYYWVRNWGSRNYKYRQAEGCGIYNERILDVQRKMWPDMSGFEALTGRLFSHPAPRFKLNKTNSVPTATYKPMQQVCAPAVVVLDYIFPNRYAGETLKTKVNVINNSEITLNKPSVEIFIEQKGKRIRVLKVPVKSLVVGEKQIISVKFAFPNISGSCLLKYTLKDGDKVLCDRNLKLNARKRNKVFEAIKTDKKIQLYDCVGEVFAAFGKVGSSTVLKAFGLGFEPAGNFDKLDKCDLLVIGADSFDAKLQDNAEKIRKYLDNGGRVLVFEQSSMGRLPFLPELEYSLAGPGQFAEILRRSHPSVKNMKQNEFFCWNQKDWSVYRSFILPLSNAAILAGGDTSQWGADTFGMVATHIKVGKGTILLSQAEVTSLIRKDSGAGQFTRNILQTVLDDKAVSLARELQGKKVNVKPPARDKVVFINLKSAANMGLKDDVAGDGKGGWSDQGPKNDLRKLPTGKQRFSGIPFDILNPTHNNGKSCIVVSANPKLKFKAESKALKINRKLKKIYFLHTGAWMPSSVKVIGKYELRYASGKTIDIPLSSGEQIGDWWNAPSRKLTKGQCVWSIMNGSSVVGAFAFCWKNPFPNEKIESIKVSSNGNAVIGLLALTGEK